MYYDIYSDTVFDLAMNDDFIVSQAKTRMLEAIEQDLGRKLTQYERDNIDPDFFHTSKAECLMHIAKLAEQQKQDQNLFDDIIDQARDALMNSQEFLALEEKFFEQTRKNRGISDEDWQRITKA